MLPACRRQTGPWCGDSLGGQGVWSTEWTLGSQGGGGKGAPPHRMECEPSSWIHREPGGSLALSGCLTVWKQGLELSQLPPGFISTSKVLSPPRWFWSDCARLAAGEHGSGDPAPRAAGLCCVTACPPGPLTPCSCGTSGGAVCSSGSPSWTATSKSSCT